ncbi:MAG TPA: hypothetical protein VH643_35885, partial [Gemmataceae bacterium]
MFVFLPSLFKKFFSHLAENAVRYREARYAEREARRRLARFVRPRLEDLEGRIVLDAYTFAVNGIASNGAYTNGQLWTDTNNGSVGTVPGDNDTATIPTGAVCTLDSTEEQTIAGLTVSGSLTIRSLLTVQVTSASGSGATTVASGGLLDVTTPDINGNNSTLETSTLTTAASPPTTPNLSIDSQAEVEVGASAILSGDTSVGGLLDAQNQGAFNGAVILLAGPGSVGGSGQLEAGINAGITFGPSSSWSILADNAVGSALKEGKFFVDGPLAFTSNFVNGTADITLNDDGSTTKGSIGGSGSIDWWNGEFDWNGGTIGGLTGGGFTIENGDFKVQGSDPKVLATTMTNTGSGPADFGGTGTLTITGPGVPAGTGALINEASAVLPMDLSLPMLMGLAGDGMTPGALTNYGYLDFSGTSPMTISAPLVNEVSGVIDCATGAAPLTLSDTSGTSVLNGKLALNNDSLTISGKYTTTSGAFEEEFSANDVTTLTGTLTIDSGATADFDHLVLAEAPGGSSAGVITGAGDFSIDADGGGSNDYLTWTAGTMTGTGLTTIGPNATLTLSGLGMMGRDLDNHGKVVWSATGGIGFSAGLTLHNEKDGTFDFEGGATLPEVDNDGMLEVAAGVTPTVATFTQ